MPTPCAMFRILSVTCLLTRKGWFIIRRKACVTYVALRTSYSEPFCVSTQNGSEYDVRNARIHKNTQKIHGTKQDQSERGPPARSERASLIGHHVSNCVNCVAYVACARIDKSSILAYVRKETYFCPHTLFWQYAQLKV